MYVNLNIKYIIGSPTDRAFDHPFHEVAVKRGTEEEVEEGLAMF